MRTPKFIALRAYVCETEKQIVKHSYEGIELFHESLWRCTRACDLACSDGIIGATHDEREALYGAYLAAYGFLMLCVGVLMQLATNGIVTVKRLHKLTVYLQEANDEHLALAAELANHNEAQKWHA